MTPNPDSGRKTVDREKARELATSAKLYADSLVRDLADTIELLLAETAPAEPATVQPEPGMSDAQILQWIDVCNSADARAVLRDYMRMRGHAEPPAEPEDEVTRLLREWSDNFEWDDEIESTDAWLLTDKAKQLRDLIRAHGSAQREVGARKMRGRAMAVAFATTDTSSQLWHTIGAAIAEKIWGLNPKEIA